MCSKRSGVREEGRRDKPCYCLFKKYLARGMKEVVPAIGVIRGAESKRQLDVRERDKERPLTWKLSRCQGSS